MCVRPSVLSHVPCVCPSVLSHVPCVCPSVLSHVPCVCPSILSHVPCVFLLQHRQLRCLPHHQRHVRTHECEHVEPGGRGQVSPATQHQRAVHLHDGLSTPRLTTPGVLSHRGTGLVPLLDSTGPSLCRGVSCPVFSVTVALV